MKKRLISLLCAVAMIFSLLPMTVFAEEPIAVGLTVAPADSTKSMDALHANDIVIATVSLPAETYSSMQLKLAFDKTRFTCYYALTNELPTYKDAEIDPATGNVLTPATGGWQNVTVSSYAAANQNGYFSVAAPAYTAENVPGNVSFDEGFVVFKAYFRVLGNAPVGTATPFSILNASTEDLSINRFVDGKETTYAVTVPDSISATVVQEIDSVELTGSITTPVKGEKDKSNVTGDNVTAVVTWSPELPADGKFAANTEYTATIMVTPTDGYIVNGVADFGEFKFTKDAENNTFTAEHTFASTTNLSLSFISFDSKTKDTSKTVEIDGHAGKTVQVYAVIEDGIDASEAGLTWQVSSENGTGGGVSIDDHGLITVGPTAVAGEYTVTAEADGKAVSGKATATLTVTRAGSVYTLNISGGPESLNLPYDSMNHMYEQAYSVYIQDQYGSTLDPEIEWTVTDAVGNLVDGISVVDNKLNITRTAALLALVPDTNDVVITVKAAAKDDSNLYGVKTFTLHRAESYVKNFTLTGDGKIVIPAYGATDAVTARYSVVSATDQYGKDISISDEIRWTLHVDSNASAAIATIKGVSLDSTTGILSVGYGATEDIPASQTVYVRATIDRGGSLGEISKPYAVTIERAAPTFADLYFDVAPKTVTIPTGEPATYTYSAIILDQYRSPMDGLKATFTLVPVETDGTVPAGWSITTEGVLSITKDVKAGSQAKVEATYGNRVTWAPVTAVAIDVTFPTVNEAAAPVYGMTWSELVTLGNDGKATLDGTEVKGSFSIKKADEYPAAGDGKTYTLVFTSTDGTYTVEETKNFEQTIAKRPIEFTVRDIEITYGDQLGAYTVEKTGGSYAEGQGFGGYHADIPSISTTGAIPVDEYKIVLKSVTITDKTNVEYQDNYDITRKNGTLTVKAKNLTGTAAIDDVVNQTYTGSAIEPSLTVKDGETTLTVGTDYTVVYTDNTSVGEATATVTFKGNYSGTASTTFRIVAENLTGEFSIDTITDQPYTGRAIEPKLTLKRGTSTFEADYQVEFDENINVGTATVKVTLTGNYAGTAETTFNIVAKAIDDTTVTVGEIPAQTYTGSAITPAVVVMDGSTTLVRDTDYTVAYTNNTNVGTAAVTITGMGNYTSNRTANFPISAKSLSDDDVTLDFTPSGTTYTGSAITGTVTVKIGEKTLTEKTDYTVAYADNTGVGTATVTITGKGNYTDSKTVKFSIAKKAPTTADIVVTIPTSVVYGNAYTVTAEAASGVNGLGNITVKYGDSTTAPTGAGEYGISIEIAEGSNYTAAAFANVGTLTIAKADQAAPAVTGSYAVSSTDANKFTYTVNPIANAEYRMDNGEWQNSNVFDGIAPEESTHTFSARLKADSNHNEGAVGTTDVVTFNKLANTNVPGLTVKVSGAAGDRTVTITPVEGAEYKFGSGAWSSSNVADHVTGDSITVSIRYKATATLNASKEATQNVDLTKQNQAALTYTGGTTVTYGQKLQLSAAGGSGTGAITYTVTNGTGMATVDGSVLTATQAGKVTIVVTKAADDEYNEATSASVEITIVKATPTGEPAYTRIYSYGRTLADAKLTTGTITPAGTIFWDLGNATRVEANKAYAWTFVPADPVNYNNLTGTITPYPYRPSSSSGSFIAVAPAQNGTVKADNQNPRPGETVTITVKPDAGYMLGSLTVTDSQGNKLPLTGSNGVYSFQAPVGGANIRASFIPAYENPFMDVSSRDYYYDAVLWAVGSGITSGRTATLFAPAAACTRAETLTFLWRAAGSPMPRSSSNPFTDVKPSDYYYNAVLWAVEQGITTGATATTFNPSATVSRAEVATFLFRAEGSAKTTLSTVFTDVSADKYYADAVAWAAANNITSGVSATRFVPDASCTRAQIVTFLYRTYGLNG